MMLASVTSQGFSLWHSNCFNLFFCCSAIIDNAEINMRLGKGVMVGSLEKLGKLAEGKRARIREESMKEIVGSFLSFCLLYFL